MIPKANMNVVIPNMNILGRDKVKPGFLLKTIYCKRASSFLRRHNPQEDVGRGNVGHGIGTCDHRQGAMAKKLDEERQVSYPSPYTMPVKRLSYTAALY
jgi:hypothetical protein